MLLALKPDPTVLPATDPPVIVMFEHVTAPLLDTRNGADDAVELPA